MKKCLNCEKNYEPKRETSKFCCTSCRVRYYQKNGKQNIKPFQMQALYNSIMDAIGKIQYAKPPEVYDAPKSANIVNDEPFKFVKPITKVTADAIMRKYVEDRRDCTCEEEFRTWFERLDADERLTSKQKELVKNTL